MTDKLHHEGFPSGWYVQERSPEEALLCYKHWQGHPVCVCCKPRLLGIEDFLVKARIIAKAIVAHDAVQLAMSRAEDHADD